MQLDHLITKYFSNPVVPEQAKKGYGFVEVAPTKVDYVLGGPSQAKKIILSEDRNYIPYKPVFESQKRNGVDTYACVVFSGLNNMEIVMKKLYGIDINFSDMYQAGMTPVRPYYGTNYSNFWDSVRKNGIVLEADYPWTTQDAYEYVKTPPQNIIDLGRQFLDTYEIEHEWVDSGGCDPNKLYNALIYGPLQASVNAEATYTLKYSDVTNHSISIVASVKGVNFTILDHYRELYTVPWNFYFGSAKQATILRKKKSQLVMIVNAPTVEERAKIYEVVGSTACHISDEHTWRYGTEIGRWGGEGENIIAISMDSFNRQFTIGETITYKPVK